MSPHMVREQIARAMSQVRAAFRARLGKLNLVRPVQLANVDGLAGEAQPGLELMQHFGFTSAPPDGTQAIVVPLGGRTSASVIVATEHAQHRFVLNERGEVAIYTNDGTWIHLKRSGQVHVKSAARVLIECPLTETTGDLVVGGDVTAAGNIKDMAQGDGKTMAMMRATYNGHTHPENGASGPTGQPNQAM